MNRTLSLTAMAVAVAAFTIGVGAQGMAHVDVKDATGKSVGMAMISAKDGGVSIAIDFKGLPPR